MFEVVVVDDASQDATALIVEEIQHEHPNLRLLRHECNLGRGAARRTGQDSVDAPWIGFVDADIVVPSNWLERCLKELSNCDGVSGIAQPDGDCAVIWRICRPKIRLRNGSAQITGNNVLFSRDALNRVPFAAESKLGEDYRLAQIMTQRGLRLRTIRDLTVEHQESKSYLKGVSWMWQSGIDATSLLFEFRSVRLPDFAWLIWSIGVIAIFANAILGYLGLWESLSIALVLTLSLNAAFIASRFTSRSARARFILALLISPPMMFAYLVGRCAGLPKALLHQWKTEGTPEV